MGGGLAYKPCLLCMIGIKFELKEYSSIFWHNPQSNNSVVCVITTGMNLVPDFPLLRNEHTPKTLFLKRLMEVWAQMFNVWLYNANSKNDSLRGNLSIAVFMDVVLQFSQALEQYS